MPWAPSLFSGCRLSFTAASRRRLATVTAPLWWQLFGLWGIGGSVTKHSEQTEKMEVRISADLWYGTAAILEGNERCWVGWVLHSCSDPLQCVSEDKSGATEMHTPCDWGHDSSKRCTATTLTLIKQQNQHKTKWILIFFLLSQQKQKTIRKHCQPLLSHFYCDIY